MPGIDERLKNIGQSLLDNIASELTTRGIDVPTRQYITSGQIVFDLIGDKCGEALIVGWNGMFHGAGEDSQTFIGPALRCSVALGAQYTVALLRCVPTLDDDGKAPTVERLQESGEALLEDAMTLTAVVVDKALEQTLVDMGCSLVGLGDVLPIDGQGAIGGSSLAVVVSLV